MKVDLDRNKIGNYLNLNAKPKRLTSEQLEEMGKAAEKEREKLLSDRPELRAFQDRIDRLMQQAGSFENRMSVLGMMMEANLKELQHQLGALSRQTERWRNTIDRAAPSRDELS